MYWTLTNCGKPVETFATNHSISLDDAIKLLDIEVDDDHIFYDDLDLRLATDKERESYLRED